jgi:hypothetical protein
VLARLLLIAFVVRGTLSKLALPLRPPILGYHCKFDYDCSMRMVEIGKVEDYIRRRLAGNGNMGASSVVRLGRRAIERLALLTGLLVGLYRFGLTPPPSCQDSVSAELPSPSPPRRL